VPLKRRGARDAGGAKCRDELARLLVEARRHRLVRAGKLGCVQVSARERLDVSILQQVVFRGAMRMAPKDEERLIYIKDEEDALAAVARDDGDLAVLLNPPKIAEVKDVARAGDRMPHKSTYFYPKPLTGLVINRMD
jgi:uncharacterized protein (DUF1015 family)